MKIRCLLLGLLPSLTLATDPPPPEPKKLVPRPIPGLELEMPEAMVAPMPAMTIQPVPAAKTPAAVAGTPEQARLIYIHRRSTLPPKFLKDLPKPAAQTPASPGFEMPVQISQEAVKIIPKSEAAKWFSQEAKP